jgi:hypothetical protein
MKELITDVKFIKEYESKFGKLYSFKVSYAGRSAFYSSKTMEQTKFVTGQEAEFTEETKTSTNGSYLVIKPPQKVQQSNFGKALNKEKSRYSGFAVSYAKDMAVAGRIQVTELSTYAWILFDLMVEMDKTLEQ